MSKPVVIITGGGRGIGRTTAVHFATHGYDAVLTARSEDQLAEASEAVHAAGGKCVTVSGDATDPATAPRVVERAEHEFGRVDVLINNAGYAPLVPAHEMSDDDYKQTLAVNCDAVFYFTRAIWSSFVKQQRGIIINISSRASQDPFPGFAVYGACKAWVNIFTKSTAKAGAECGIRVFGLGPGATDTIMLRTALPDLPDDQILPPENIADAIYQLTNPAWAHSSGQTFFVAKYQ